jgi:hypothetical protein
MPYYDETIALRHRYDNGLNERHDLFATQSGERKQIATPTQLL